MRTLICQQPGKLEYQEKTLPVNKRDHAIIQIKRIGICGTDLHAYEGTQPYFQYPRILGHELAAKITDIDGQGFSVGEEVTIIPYFNCGQCIACRVGKTNCCTQMKVCGVHVDGGMVDFLQVPITHLIKGKGLTLDELALIEPLAIGAHGIRRADVKPGEFVLVVGAGPIGLGTMEFARIAGARVIALDINSGRLDFCKSELKVDYTINALEVDVIERLKEITNGDMPTVVIDATGSLKAINGSFQYMAHGARFVLIGLQKGNIEFSHPEFHKREATLMSSRNATHSDFDYVINSISNRKVNPKIYITHRVSFDNVVREFDSWLNPKTGVIKAMVEVN